MMEGSSGCVGTAVKTSESSGGFGGLSLLYVQKLSKQKFIYFTEDDYSRGAAAQPPKSNRPAISRIPFEKTSIDLEKAEMHLRGILDKELKAWRRGCRKFVSLVTACKTYWPNGSAIGPTGANYQEFFPIGIRPDCDVKQTSDCNGIGSGTSRNEKLFVSTSLTDHSSGCFVEMLPAAVLSMSKMSLLSTVLSLDDPISRFFLELCLCVSGEALDPITAVTFLQKRLLPLFFAHIIQLIDEIEKGMQFNSGRYQNNGDVISAPNALEQVDGDFVPIKVKGDSVFHAGCDLIEKGGKYDIGINADFNSNTVIVIDDDSPRHPPGINGQIEVNSQVQESATNACMSPKPKRFESDVYALVEKDELMAVDDCSENTSVNSQVKYDIDPSRSLHRSAENSLSHLRIFPPHANLDKCLVKDEKVAISTMPNESLSIQLNGHQVMEVLRCVVDAHGCDPAAYRFTRKDSLCLFQSTHIPLPFRAIFLDTLGAAVELLAFAGPLKAPLRKARSLMAKLCGLVTSVDISSYVPPGRLDEMGWRRAAASGSPSRSRAVTDLLAKEKTKRRFTMVVYNACRENLRMYSRLFALMVNYSNTQEIVLEHELFSSVARLGAQGSLCSARMLALTLLVYEDNGRNQNDLLKLASRWGASNILMVIRLILRLYMDAKKGQTKTSDEDNMRTTRLPSSLKSGQAPPASSTDASSGASILSVASPLFTLPDLNDRLWEAISAGPSFSFFCMLAMLVAHGILILEDVYTYLYPHDALLICQSEQLGRRYRLALSAAHRSILPTPPRHKPPTKNAAAVPTFETPSAGQNVSSLGITENTLDQETQMHRTPSSQSAAGGQTMPISRGYGTTDMNSQRGSYGRVYNHVNSDSVPPAGTSGHSSSKAAGSFGDTNSSENRNDIRQEQTKSDGYEHGTAEYKRDDDSNPVNNIPGAKEFLLRDDMEYRTARENVYFERVGKYDLLGALIDINSFENVQQLILHFTAKIRTLPTLNYQVLQSLAKFIRWLIEPLVRSPGCQLRQLLRKFKPSRKTKFIGVPSIAASAEESGVASNIPNTSPGQFLSTNRNGIEVSNQSGIPSGEQLLKLRIQMRNGTLDYSKINSYWVGLLLPSRMQRVNKGTTLRDATSDIRRKDENVSQLNYKEEKREIDETFVCQGLMPCRTVEDFIEYVLPLCTLLHTSLSSDTDLFLGVLDVLRMIMVADNRNLCVEYSPRKRLRVELVDSFIVKTIFPSLSQVLNGSVALNIKLWSVLELIPASQRYKIYERVFSLWESNHFPLSLNYEVVRIKLRKLLKRLTSSIFDRDGKAQDRPILSEITSLALIAPFPLAEAVMVQADLFDENMVQTLTEATRNVSKLAADIFAWQFLVRQVCGSNIDRDGDGPPHAKKLMNRSSMVGLFFKMHYTTDLRPFLISTLSRMFCEFHPTDILYQQSHSKALGQLVEVCGKNKNYPHDLVGFYREKEYIEKLVELMGECPKLPEAGALTQDQIFAQAGGPLLKIAVMLADVTNAGCVYSPEARGALLSALCDSHLVRPLFLIAAKIRCELMYDSDFRCSLQQYVCILDDLHVYQLQLIEFFSRLFGVFTSKSLLTGVTSSLSCRVASNMSLLDQKTRAHLYRSLIPPAIQLFQFFPHAMAWAIWRPALLDFMTQRKSNQDISLESSTDEAATCLWDSANASVLNPYWDEELLQDLPMYVNDRQGRALSSGFLLLFWRMSLEDVMVPNKQYTSCIEKLSSGAEEVKAELELLEKKRAGGNNGSNVMSLVADYECREAELKGRLNRLETQCGDLRAEWLRHQKRFVDVKKALRIFWNNWLTPEGKNKLILSGVSISNTERLGNSLCESACESNIKTSTSASVKLDSASPMDMEKDGTEQVNGSLESFNYDVHSCEKPPIVTAVSRTAKDDANKYKKDCLDDKMFDSLRTNQNTLVVEPLKDSFKSSEHMQEFVKSLLAPRLMNSEADALFCANFVKLMLDAQTEFFHFVDFMNIWTRMIVLLIRSSTEREAHLLGLFVTEMLAPVRVWLDNTSEFERMTSGNCCFLRSYQCGSGDQITYSDLLKAAKMWEERIFNALVQCIPTAHGANGPANNSVWLQMKAVVVFLSRCHPAFPLTHNKGCALIDALNDAILAAQSWGWKDVVLSAGSIAKVLSKCKRENQWLEWHESNGTNERLLSPSSFMGKVLNMKPDESQDSSSAERRSTSSPLAQPTGTSSPVKAKNALGSITSRSDSPPAKKAKVELSQASVAHEKAQSSDSISLIPNNDESPPLEHGSLQTSLPITGSSSPRSVSSMVRARMQRLNAFRSAEFSAASSSASGKTSSSHAANSNVSEDLTRKGAIEDFSQMRPLSTVEVAVEEPHSVLGKSHDLHAGENEVAVGSTPSKTPQYDGERQNRVDDGAVGQSLSSHTAVSIARGDSNVSSEVETNANKSLSVPTSKGNSENKQILIPENLNVLGEKSCERGAVVSTKADDRRNRQPNSRSGAISDINSNDKVGSSNDAGTRKPSGSWSQNEGWPTNSSNKVESSMKRATAHPSVVHRVTPKAPPPILLSKPILPVKEKQVAGSECDDNYSSSTTGATKSSSTGDENIRSTSQIKCVDHQLSEAKDSRHNHCSTSGTSGGSARTENDRGIRLSEQLVDRKDRGIDKQSSGSASGKLANMNLHGKMRSDSSVFSISHSANSGNDTGRMRHSGSGMGCHEETSNSIRDSRSTAGSSFDGNSSQHNNQSMRRHDASTVLRKGDDEQAWTQRASTNSKDHLLAAEGKHRMFVPHTSREGITYSRSSGMHEDRRKTRLLDEMRYSHSTDNITHGDNLQRNSARGQPPHQMPYSNQQRQTKNSSYSSLCQHQSSPHSSRESTPQPRNALFSQKDTRHPSSK